MHDIAGEAAEQPIAFFTERPPGGLNYLCCGIRRFHDHAGPALRQLARQFG
jgi:uncharacterized protein